jgi:hypothetical protein
MAKQSQRIPSKSYLRFESVIKRSLNLLSLQQAVEKLFAGQKSPPDASDMTRAAVTLAVAGMDAYFTGVFAERLVPFLKKKKTPPKALCDLLQKAGLDTATAIELLGMDRPYRRIRKLMDCHLEKHVSQRIDVIDELFLSYGLKDFCDHAQRKAKRRNLLKSIQRLVERRHEIAHKGDVNSHGRLQKITPTQIKTLVMHLVKFVASADEILQGQLASIKEHGHAKKTS